jgi:hypothetical protein
VIFGFLGGEPGVEMESPSSSPGAGDNGNGNGNFGAMGGGFVFALGSVPSFGILDLASWASFSAWSIRVSSDGGPSAQYQHTLVCSCRTWDGDVPLVQDLNLSVPPPIPTRVRSESFHDLTGSRRGNAPASPPLFGVKYGVTCRISFCHCRLGREGAYLRERGQDHFWGSDGFREYWYT